MNDTTTESIFKAFLLPGPGQQLSVCLELNTAHPVVSGSSDDKTVREWLQNIRKFPEVIDALATRLQVIASDGKPYPLSPVATYDKTAAADLWTRFLGFNNIGPGTQSAAGAGFSEAALGGTLVVPVRTEPAVQLKAEPALQAAATSNSQHQQASQQLVQQPSIAGFFAALDAHEMVNGIGAPLQEHLGEGIQRAYEVAKAITQRENQAILEHQAVMAKVRSLASHNQPKTAAATEVQTFLHTLDVAHNAVAGSAAYVVAALDKLSGFTAVRRLTGLLLTYITEGLPPGTTTLQLQEISPLIKALQPPVNAVYIDTRPVTCVRANPFGPGFLVDTITDAVAGKPEKPGYDHFVADTILRLEHLGALVKTYEPQSVAHNKTELRQLVLTTGDANVDGGVDRQQISALRQKDQPDYPAMLKLQAVNRLYEIGRLINNRMTDIQTKGHQLYASSKAWIGYDPSASESKDQVLVHEHNVLAGYAVFVKITGTHPLDWVSLTELEEKQHFPQQESAYQPVEIPVLIDNAVHYLDPSAIGGGNVGENLLQGIGNGFLFSWEGRTVSSRNPIRYRDPEDKPSKKQLQQRYLQVQEDHQRLPLVEHALHRKGKKVLSVDWFPQKKQLSALYNILRRFRFQTDEPEKLKFSEQTQYSYVMAAQYLNGHTPVTASLLRELDRRGALKGLASTPVPFLRHEHINEVLVSLALDIYQGNKQHSLRPQHLGESATDLVVRSGSLLNDHHCSRYILPPQVPSLQTYLWYDREAQNWLNTRQLSDTEAHYWYQRYQCENKQAADFEKNIQDCQELNEVLPAALQRDCAKAGCAAHCRSFCGGTTQPAIYAGMLHYLPDPVVTGFVIRFFADKECLLPADEERYPETFCAFSGNYPALQPWEIRLSKTTATARGRQVTTGSNHSLYINLPPGAQLYAELIPTYRETLACLYPSILPHEGYAKKTSDYYYNRLYAGVKKMSFTHASQWPVVTPVITALQLERFRASTPGKTATSLTAQVTLTYEHLNLWRGLAMPDTQPTGELDLYAAWDDYAPDQRAPQRTIRQKRAARQKDEGLVYLGKIVFAEAVNRGPVYQQALTGENNGTLTGTIRIEAGSGFTISYFTDAVFRIKNTSRFSRYFTATAYDDLSPEAKDQFSLLSPDCYAPPVKPDGTAGYSAISYLADPAHNTWTATANYLFNNTKPAEPVIEKIVPLLIRDRDDHQHEVTYRYNRARLYFSQIGASGKDRRVGVIIATATGIYPELLKDHRSKAGRDAVTDRTDNPLAFDNAAGWLTASAFPIDPQQMEAAYLQTFAPQYDTQLPDPIGLVSYQPQYDPEQNLWYADIELNLHNAQGKELHHPFVQLGLVSYQPYSANYAATNTWKPDTPDYFENDYRLSAPVRAAFFSIYPSRTFQFPAYLFRHRHNQQHHFSLTGAAGSLFLNSFTRRIDTEFIICVQEKKQGDKWITRNSWLTYLQQQVGKQTRQGPGLHQPRLYHCLLNQGFTDLATDLSADLSIEVKLDFDRSLFKDHRIVIYEMDNHGPQPLWELTRDLETELTSLPHIRPRDIYIFD